MGNMSAVCIYIYISIDGDHIISQVYASRMPKLSTMLNKSCPPVIYTPKMKQIDG